MPFSKDSLSREFYLSVLITCCNFAGVVGLLAREPTVFVPAAGVVLALDFIKSGRKEMWPIVKLAFLVLPAVAYWLLNAGFGFVDASMPGFGIADTPVAQWSQPMMIEAAAAIVIFSGLLADYLNSVVAWSEEHDQQLARARAGKD